MVRPTALAVLLFGALLAFDARAQSAPAKSVPLYTQGPVTQMSYMHVEYGHFEEYIAWLDSTWKPTMEAFKKAGITTDYKVVRLNPRGGDDANLILMITYKDMASYGGDIGDRSADEEEVADKVICDTECQNKARVARGQIRKVLGVELVREIILK